jgi:hypothetical protein
LTFAEGIQFQDTRQRCPKKKLPFPTPLPGLGKTITTGVLHLSSIFCCVLAVRSKGDILTDTTGLCNYMAFELAELAAENLFQVSSLGEEASYPVSRHGEGSP